MVLSRVRRPAAIRLAGLGCLAAALVACAAPAVQQQARASQSINEVGLTQYSNATRTLPAAITGHTLAGSTLSLDALSGDVVVLNVWASWCGPCRSETPALARASVAFAGDPVRFVGIDEQDGSSQARAFVASAGATYPDLVDSDGTLLEKLRLLPQAAVPSTLVLDRRGRIADRVIGPVTQAEITTLVSELLKET